MLDALSESNLHDVELELRIDAAPAAVDAEGAAVAQRDAQLGCARLHRVLELGERQPPLRSLSRGRRLLLALARSVLLRGRLATHVWPRGEDGGKRARARGAADQLKVRSRRGLSDPDLVRLLRVRTHPFGARAHAEHLQVGRLGEADGESLVRRAENRLVVGPALDAHAADSQSGGRGFRGE